MMVGGLGTDSWSFARCFCSQIMPRRSRKLVGSSRIKMSVGWRSIDARLVRILHPPDKILTGLSKFPFGNPKPTRMFRALTSMSASLVGSSCNCSSARSSAARSVSSLIVASLISSLFWLILYFELEVLCLSGPQALTVPQTPQPSSQRQSMLSVLPYHVFHSLV